jgi:repressor LexA
MHYSELLFACQQYFVTNLLNLKHLFANICLACYDNPSEKYMIDSGGFYMANGKISVKQQEILEYIKAQLLAKGYPPSVREICEAVKLRSTSSVHSHLETLEKNGYIRRDPTKPRAIEILDDEFALSRRELVNIPMIGTVTAGEPILAVENISGYYPVPAEMLPNADLFMLLVRGDSMINAGILSGDHVIVQQQSTAVNGDIVVALVDDSATVKTFYKEDGYYRLQPQNDALSPIITRQCEILGKVIGLVRIGM